MTNREVQNEIADLHRRIRAMNDKRIEIEGVLEQSLMTLDGLAPEREGRQARLNAHYAGPFALELLNKASDEMAIHTGHKHLTCRTGVVYGGLNSFLWPNPEDVPEEDQDRYFIPCPTATDQHDREDLRGTYYVIMHTECKSIDGEWQHREIGPPWRDFPGPWLEISKENPHPQLMDVIPWEFDDASVDVSIAQRDVIGRVLVAGNADGENVFCSPDQWKRDHIYAMQWHWWPNEHGVLYGLSLECPIRAVNVNHGHEMEWTENDGTHQHLLVEEGPELVYMQRLRVHDDGSHHSHVHIEMHAASGEEDGEKDDTPDV